MAAIAAGVKKFKILTLMHKPPELNAQDETIVCFIEMNDSKPMDMRVSWFLFNHCIDNLCPAIVAVSMSEGVLKERVVCRPDCPAGAVDFIKFIIVFRESIWFNEGVIVAEVAA